VSKSKSSIFERKVAKMTYVTLKASDESGEFQAYTVFPTTKEKAPVIIIIQEIFGINKNVRDICDLYASKGYIALAPDLFWRQEPGIDITDQTQAEWDKAFELFNGFNVDNGVEDLATTLNYARSLDGSNGRVGCVGYCLGGKLAYLMSARTDIDCAVSYYGVGLNELVGEKDKITTPLLMHVAEKDQFVPREAQEIMEMHLKPHPCIDYHVYEGMDHAFTRINGAHYDADNAQIANERSYSFFSNHLK